MGRAAPRGALGRDGRCFDLRPRAGGAKPDSLRDEVFSGRDQMTAITTKELEAMRIAFKLNGNDVVADGNETIIQAAKRHGIEIPHLCYKEGMRPDGNCRACMVEVKGERVLAASCCRKPAPGMEVTTDSARAVHSQKMVLELLLSDMPTERHTLRSELDHWAARLEVGKPRFAKRANPPADLSHYAIAVNLDS